MTDPKRLIERPPLSEEAISLIAARFRVLGDPSRIRLLDLLMRCEMSVQELVEASEMSQTNVSRHLGLLRREGVVARRREGKLAVYRIADPSIEALCTLVCGGIESHLEGGLDALQGGGP
jgi:ArsR family transcriptional regulator